MLIYAAFVSQGITYLRALQAEQRDNGYDIISVFPEKYLSHEELGHCIEDKNDYMVVDTNPHVALLCLRKILTRKLVEARMQGRGNEVEVALKSVMAAERIVKDDKRFL